MHKIWLYIVPKCTHEIILGKNWLEDQDAVVHSKDQRLELRKQKFSINSVRRWRQNLRNVARPKYTTAEAMAFMVDTVPVFKASLEDVSKALRDKPKLSVEQAKSRLPDQVKDFARLFADENGAEDLPPSRENLDHAINLRRDNGKPMTPPWSPLYNMSREELLVLRKTLSDLLRKGWIRPSSSSSVR